MKTILGLDVGTNSIGWALIQQDVENNLGSVNGIGCRIIPMPQDVISDFDKGQSKSATAERTRYRSVRKLIERRKLRRERLHRILNILGCLPYHYASQIDFIKNLGKFLPNTEPKIAYFLNSKGQNEFLFKDSYSEMLEEFKISQPEFLNSNGKIPYDWTLYYLRKKALKKMISKEELAWILLNFNQKRGYYQLRGEEEESNNANKTIEYHALHVEDVISLEEFNAKKQRIYQIKLENGWSFYKPSSFPILWKGKLKNFIVTTEIDRNGMEKRTFRSPDENDWTLLKKKTESVIIKSEKTIGTFIYDKLLQNPHVKVIGNLVRTVDRSLYKEELEEILNVQLEFHQEFKDQNLLKKCIIELYSSNENHRDLLNKKNLKYLLIEDILFYQRPLKSKKSLISDCKFENRYYYSNNELQVRPLKCIPKSHPLFQEFRLLQFIENLRVYKKEDKEVDITKELFSTYQQKQDLLSFLNDRKEIDQKSLFKFFGKQYTTGHYRWNYVDKAYPCNETRSLILNYLSKLKSIEKAWFSQEKEIQLWHILFSVNDLKELLKGLKKFAFKNNLPTDFADVFVKIKPFDNDYGSYSEKAIKKLLSLMRFGKSWTADLVDKSTKQRIENLINAEYDDKIQNRIREKAIELQKIEDYQGLPLWLASYIIYNRHSEEGNIQFWKRPSDIRLLQQHSLRNPIVEQVINETLKVVKNIWTEYGQSNPSFFDEIHIELGREMKNPNDVRKAITERNIINENTNLRIRALLQELANDQDVLSVRPHSPNQIEILKIYEDFVLNSSNELPEDIAKISKASQPTKAELRRYKLWLEQKYRSPYTGNMIPLNKLFTSVYEIEHIIPQSRFFDDSLSNKVICESEVNKLKDNQLGLEFIKNHHGEKINSEVKIFEEAEYIEFVNNHYGKNKQKRQKLLMEEIPDAFIERQMNDTRYISKLIKSLLSNIVREQNEQETTSKNLLSSTGGITTILKQDWGLNEKWNELITPRFERMNVLTNSQDFGSWTNKEGKRVFQISVPIKYAKGFNKKRIDHRHHALDALIIATATRNHINYLNNQHANEYGKSEEQRKKYRHDLRSLLCYKHKTDDKGNYKWRLIKPWNTFTQDAMEKLENTIVSFKQNVKIIAKASNYYQKYENGKKVFKKQETGHSISVRKPLHKETIYGKIHLPWLSVPKGKITTASRKTLNSDFDVEAIDKITDRGIQKILHRYLEFKGNDPNIAFSSDGIDELNANIEQFNNGKFHQPIYKVRTYEIGERFPVGTKGNNHKKYVEAAKGTNLYFAIYYDETKKKRVYETIPLNIVVERLKQKLPPVPAVNELGYKLLFHLSPNDLVYVPKSEIIENYNYEDLLEEVTQNIDRIYKTVSFSTSQVFFLQSNISITIVNKMEFSSLNKMERAITGEMIKELCWKVEVSSIGKIIKIVK